MARESLAVLREGVPRLEGQLRGTRPAPAVPRRNGAPARNLVVGFVPSLTPDVEFEND